MDIVEEIINVVKVDYKYVIGDSTIEKQIKGENKINYRKCLNKVSIFKEVSTSYACLGDCLEYRITIINHQCKKIIVYLTDCIDECLCGEDICDKPIVLEPFEYKKVEYTAKVKCLCNCKYREIENRACIKFKKSGKVLYSNSVMTYIC